MKKPANAVSTLKPFTSSQISPSLLGLTPRGTYVHRENRHQRARPVCCFFRFHGARVNLISVFEARPGENG